MQRGIRDKVAIIGMGCARFGERWDSDPADLMVEAFEECLADAGIEKRQIDAAWFASGLDAFNVGPSAMPLAVALRLPYIAVTRVENLCASGTEAIRGAAYAVASGACDIALALGCEKLKDTGYGGLPQRTRGVTNDMFYPNLSAPGNFAQLATGYATAHRVDRGDLKRAMAHVSVKSHANATKSPKAHLRKAITMEQALAAPMIAEPIGLFDACGVSDGAACALLARPEIAAALGRGDAPRIKSLQICSSNGSEYGHTSWDGATIRTTRLAAQRAYAEAGITDPRTELSFTEVHDCFSITELVTMEDLGLCDPGTAIRDVLDGRFDATGAIPCQIDGGLKCFGHPVAASGIRMIYEAYQQLRGRAEARQLANVRLALTHNLGGMPALNVAAVSIIGQPQ